MELVDKLGDVAGLRGQLRSSAVDDFGIESEALRDVDAGGRARDADFQIIGGLQSFLVESDGRVENAGRVGGVDLERSVVGGDDADASDVIEVSGDGDGERCSFFGIGGGAEFIEQNERVARGGARDEVDVGDVGGRKVERFCSID